VDREGLWFRLLVARYGLGKGWLQARRHEGSVWWKDIISVRDGGGYVVGSWFPDNYVFM